MFVTDIVIVCKSPGTHVCVSSVMKDEKESHLKTLEPAHIHHIIAAFRHKTHHLHRPLMEESEWMKLSKSEQVAQMNVYRFRQIQNIIIYVYIFCNELVPAAPQHPFLLCCSTSGSPEGAKQKFI